MADELASFLVSFAADLTRVDAAMDSAVSKGRTKGQRTAEAFASGVRSRIAERFGGGGLLGGLIGDDAVGAASFGASLSVGRGILEAARASSQAATETAGYRRALVGISQDARLAENALRSLQGIAADTNYDMGQVAQYAIKLAGKTGDVPGGVTRTGTTLDAAQVIGVGPQTFEAFQINLGQLLSRGNQQVESVQLQQIRNNAPLLSAVVGRTLGISVPEADKRLQSLTGNQLIALIERIGRANQGAASRAAAQDPQSVIANIRDEVWQGIAPTGELINRALIPGLTVVKNLTGGFRELNQATGGAAGLTVGVAATTIGVGLFVFGLRTARNALATATGAVYSLAAAARTLTVSAGVSSVSNAATVATAAGRGAPQGVLGSRTIQGLTASAPAAASAPTVVGAGGGSLLRSIGAVIGFGLLGLGIEAGAGAVANRLDQSQNGKSRPFGPFVRGIGSGIGIGVVTGAGIGSIVPGVGTAIGALVGGAVGAVGGTVYGVFQTLKANSERGEKTAKQQVKATEDLTAALKDAAGDVIGGGKRARSAVSLLEYEYAGLSLTRHAAGLA